jgi:hypothetical protein
MSENLSLTINIPINSSPWKKPVAPEPRAAGAAAGAGAPSTPDLRIRIPPNEEHIQSLMTEINKLIRSQKKL